MMKSDLSAPPEKDSQGHKLENYSMKFPKPRYLVANDYPDLRESQPDLIKKRVQEIVYPKEGTEMQKNLDQSIEFLKAQQKERAKKASQKITKVNLAELGRNLYFVNCYIDSNRSNRETLIRALVDTGAANSLLHTSVVNKLGLKYTPIQLTLATATGLTKNAMKSLRPIKSISIDKKGKVVMTRLVILQILNLM
jgi:predicted aspartyl protease